MGCISSNENKGKINNRNMNYSINENNKRQRDLNLKNEKSFDRISNISLNINQMGDINRYNDIKEFEGHGYY